MLIDIYYFTSTGNTLWLALRAKRILEAGGHRVSLFDVVRHKSGISENCGLFGMFYPVWGSNFPEPLREFVYTLKEGRGRKVFLLGNCALFTGDTGLYWKRILDSKGFDVFYINHLIMPTNCCLPGFNFIKVPQKKAKEKMLKAAESRLKRICGEIVAGSRRKDGVGPLSRLGGTLQRHFLSSWESARKKEFLVNKQRCTGCRICQRLCPAENIAVRGRGDVDFGDKCIFCLKCYNLCPTNAVLVGPASSDDKRYKRYKGPANDIKPILYR